MDFGEFKSINIEVPSCGITVEAGKKYGLDYQLSAAYEVTEVAIREGVLHFHCKHRYPVALFHWNGRSNYVRVTVPREAWLERTDVSNISGPIDITGIRTGILWAKGVSGRIAVSGVTVQEGVIEDVSGSLTIDNSVFERLTQKGKSGSFHGLSLTTSSLDSELVSGSIRLNGKFSGETKLRTISGSIEMNSELPLSEYRYFLKTASGSKRVNGQPGERMENPSASHSVTAQATSGSIRLNFAG